MSLLEIAEANGMEIEAGCRMGICGADPVAIKDGMSCTSAISDDEKATLERLGYAEEHPHGVLRARHWPGLGRADAGQGVRAAPEPDPSTSTTTKTSSAPSSCSATASRASPPQITAADATPGVQIDLIAEEPHHLYNRMGISRLVYGRSAMQGLYLNPDTWYDERAINTWLNTRALFIHCASARWRWARGRARLRPP